MIHYHLQEPFDDPPSRTTVYRALEGLEEHDYVRDVEWSPTLFELTWEGEEYLDGESGEEPWEAHLDDIFGFG